MQHFLKKVILFLFALTVSSAKSSPSQRTEDEIYDSAVAHFIRIDIEDFLRTAKVNREDIMEGIFEMEANAITTIISIADIQRCERSQCSTRFQAEVAAIQSEIFNSQAAIFAAQSRISDANSLLYEYRANHATDFNSAEYAELLATVRERRGEAALAIAREQPKVCGAQLRLDAARLRFYASN